MAEKFNEEIEINKIKEFWGGIPPETEIYWHTAGGRIAVNNNIVIRTQLSSLYPEGTKLMDKKDLILKLITK